MTKLIKLHNLGIEVYKLVSVPNFIRRVCDDFPVPIYELSDAQIKKIGKIWTDTLLANAKEKRKKNRLCDAD